MHDFFVTIWLNEKTEKTFKAYNINLITHIKFRVEANSQRSAIAAVKQIFKNAEVTAVDI